MANAVRNPQNQVFLSVVSFWEISVKHGLGKPPLPSAPSHFVPGQREKHLIGLAVTTTRGCIYCTGGRLKKALDAAIPYETLIAAVDLAAAVNAGVTAATAIQGAELNGIRTPGCKDCGCGIK